MLTILMVVPDFRSLCRLFVNIFFGRRTAISIKILIVDDEEFILEETLEALTDEGYECFRASNVEAAVEMIQITPGIALILSDLNMPGKRALTWSKSLKQS